MTTDDFIKSAMKYLNDSYSQPKRMQKGYSDCSSLVQKAGGDIGLWNREDTVTTKKIKLGDKRFKRIPLAEIKKGDILWWQKQGIVQYMGHVGIYLGNGKVLEAIKPKVVITQKNRLDWQRAYRIKALEEKITTNVPIVICGKELKTKGYIVNDTTFVDVKGKSLPVRIIFEALGCKVKWKNNKVEIDV